MISFFSALGYLNAQVNENKLRRSVSALFSRVHFPLRIKIDHMKRKITFLLLSLSFCAQAQLFTGVGGKILNNGQDSYFNLVVSGLNPANLDSTFGIEKVCLAINHPDVTELQIYLESPTGTQVELSEGSSCLGADYTGTCFDSKANTSVTLGTSPYTGTYKPIGYLGRFNNGQPGNGTWRLIIHDYLAFVDSGNTISWSIQFGSATVPPVNLKSSNLPIVFINTLGKKIEDTDIVVNMGIVYNGAGQRNYISDPWNNYNGKTRIHIRGSSTRHLEKKSFSLELSDAFGNELNVPILGMPAESDWILQAPYRDKTFQRIPLTYHLSRQMGHYSARYEYVELVVNNEYRGVYLLMEKIKREKNRVDVEKLSPGDSLGASVTGGYIIKIDRPDEAGWYSLKGGNAQNNAPFYYQYVYPKDSDITVPQKKYIKGYMDNFEAIMDSSIFNDAMNGYAKYIDVGSFVDYFILNELSKNVDAYRLSTYLYKDNINDGGKLHIGPVWDYDIAWHNCNYGNAFDPTGWQYQQKDTSFPPPRWWSRLMTDSSFVNKLFCRWKELRTGLLKSGTLYSFIDSSAIELDESQKRNFTQWPIMAAYIYPNPQNQTGATYLGEVGDLKGWIASRSAWMDGAIQGNCITVGSPANSFAVNSVTVYPNPFELSTTFLLHLAEDAEVMLQVVDVTGKEVSRPLNEHSARGEYRIQFDRKQMAAGMYFYRLGINNIFRTGKLIVQ